MNRYSKLYQEGIEMAKIIKCRVIHSHNKPFGAGRFKSYGVITLSKKSKNTMEGVYALYHELSHALDYLNGKFPKWFDCKWKSNQWIPLSYIRRFEGSACQQAKNYLIHKKVPLKQLNNIPENTKSGFEECLLTYWLPKYNKLNPKIVEKWVKKLNEKVKVRNNGSSRNGRKSGRSGCKNC